MKGEEGEGERREEGKEDGHKLREGVKGERKEGRIWGLAWGSLQHCRGKGERINTNLKTAWSIQQVPG